VQEHCHIIEVQTGGRLVEDKKIFVLMIVSILSGFRFSISGLSQVTNELQSL